MLYFETNHSFLRGVLSTQDQPYFDPFNCSCRPCSLFSGEADKIANNKIKAED